MLLNLFNIKKKNAGNELAFLNRQLKNGFDQYEFLNSGFVQTADGMACSGNKGYGYFFETRIESYLDRAVFRVKIKFGSPSVFGIYRRGGIGGSYAIVDLIDRKIKLCYIWDGASQPVVIASSDITMSIDLSHDYYVDLIKKGGVNSVRLTDINTGAKDLLQFDNGSLASNANGTGLMWGVYGFSHWAGYSTVESVKVIYDAKLPLLYSCYGDSITEGNSLIGLGNNYNDRWCYKLYTHFNNQVLISGQGGATSGDLLTRLNFDNAPSQYSIVFIGANDTDFTTWQNNVLSIISKIESAGSIPIICTILPRDDRQIFINNANDYILNTLSLSYQILDFAYVLTVGGDRVTRISSYFLYDNVHPNIDGHEQLYQYCLTQLT